MMNPAEATALVAAFNDSEDGAALKSQELVLLLLRASPEPFSRSQFLPGHITCTGLVLSPAKDALLAVHHRRLDRWLLPGGHVEAEDRSLQHAAWREVVEETGAELPEIATKDNTPLIGIDVHGIPSNGREPYHLHHDLVFLFHAHSAAIRGSEESHNVAWIQPRDFDNHALPDNVRRSYRRALSNLR